MLPYLFQNAPLLLRNGSHGNSTESLVFCIGPTVDLVILACLDFNKFVILGLFWKFKIDELSIFKIGGTIIIIFARYLILQICPPREIHNN